MSHSILHSFTEKKAKEQKALAVLIDPDQFEEKLFRKFCTNWSDDQPDYFFVGGSHLTTEKLDKAILAIKRNCKVPVILFPGSPQQISDLADGILLLSLISGRNPELLIGKHVEAAHRLKKSSLEIIPTAYMLVNGGNITTVQYVTQTVPIPHDKHDVAISTAWAGEMLGLQANYMDAGSGAKNHISEAMIREVSGSTKNPLIVGGGIRSGEEAYNICAAGADIIVVGNALEKTPALISELLAATHAFNTSEEKIKSKN